VLEQLIVEVAGATELIEVAEQGPPGPQGPPGGSGSELTIFTAGDAVSGHQALAAQGSGAVVHASCLVAAHLGAVAGIATEAAAAAAPVSVRTAGLMQHAGWTFTPDQPVFLGAAGALVQALPVGALFAQVLGWARSATLLQVSLQPPVLLQP